MVARRSSLAADLLDGRDLGQPAVVVDVASSRTWHGRLAVLYPQGQAGVPDEISMLRAYAGHAAVPPYSGLSLSAWAVGSASVSSDWGCWDW